MTASLYEMTASLSGYPSIIGHVLLTNRSYNAGKPSCSAWDPAVQLGVSHYPLLKFRWDNPKNGQDIPKYGRVILALPGSRFTRVWLPCAAN